MPIHKTSDVKNRFITAELQDRLDSHKSGPEEQQLHAALKQQYKEIIARVNENIVDSREKSQALTELEASFMWLGKAIFTPDNSPKVSAEQPKKPVSVLWDGLKNRHVEEWLGQDFVGWSNRNVAGPYPDEIILTIMSGPAAVEVPKNATLVRIDTGEVVILEKAS